MHDDHLYSEVAVCAVTEPVLVECCAFSGDDLSVAEHRGEQCCASLCKVPATVVAAAAAQVRSELF